MESPVQNSVSLIHAALSSVRIQQRAVEDWVNLAFAQGLVFVKSSIHVNRTISWESCPLLFWKLLWNRCSQESRQSAEGWPGHVWLRSTWISGIRKSSFEFVEKVGLKGGASLTLILSGWTGSSLLFGDGRWMASIKPLRGWNDSLSDLVSKYCWLAFSSSLTVMFAVTQKHG